VKPIVLSMLICDHYYRDAGTGKSVIAGTFSSINCGSFPATHGNCAVYIAMCDVAQEGVAQLHFRKENGGFSTSLPTWTIAVPDDRRTVIEIGGNINGLPLPDAGGFEFVLTWNGNEIASRRLAVQQIDIPPEQHD